MFEFSTGGKTERGWRRGWPPGWNCAWLVEQIFCIIGYSEWGEINEYLEFQKLYNYHFSVVYIIMYYIFLCFPSKKQKKKQRNLPVISTKKSIQAIQRSRIKKSKERKMVRMKWSSFTNSLITYVTAIKERQLLKY